MSSVDPTLLAPLPGGDQPPLPGWYRYGEGRLDCCNWKASGSRRQYTLDRTCFVQSYSWKPHLARAETPLKADLIFAPKSMLVHVRPPDLVKSEGAKKRSKKDTASDCSSAAGSDISLPPSPVSSPTDAPPLKRRRTPDHPSASVDSQAPLAVNRGPLSVTGAVSEPVSLPDVVPPHSIEVSDASGHSGHDGPGGPDLTLPLPTDSPVEDVNLDFTALASPAPDLEFEDWLAFP